MQENGFESALRAMHRCKVNGLSEALNKIAAADELETKLPDLVDAAIKYDRNHKSAQASTLAAALVQSDLCDRRKIASIGCKISENLIEDFERFLKEFEGLLAAQTCRATANSVLKQQPVKEPGEIMSVSRESNVL